jgi:hypothetical protein
MYFSLRSILLMVLVCHLGLPATVRIPSASSPAAILSIGMVMDIWTEKGNDTTTYDSVATQERL